MTRAEVEHRSMPTLVDLSQVTLVKASAAQIIECHRRELDFWGRGLSFQEREDMTEMISGGEHAADGKFVTWVLAPRDDPTTLDFKCSCKTYRRQAVVVVPKLVPSGNSKIRTNKGEQVSVSTTNINHGNSDGKFELIETTSYGVATVYTKPEYRGKGYALRMMSLLHWVIRDRSLTPDSEFPQEWGKMPPECNNEFDGGSGGTSWGGAFSVLYSDVGDFYELAGPKGGRDGWVVKDVWSTIWEVPATPTQVESGRIDPDEHDNSRARSIPPQSSTRSTNASVHLLTESSLPNIWALDAGWMKEDLLERAHERASISSSAHNPLITILPAQGGASLPHMHSKFHLKYFGREELKVWGAVVEDIDAITTGRTGESGPNLIDKSFTTWQIEVPSHRSVPPRKLILTRLRATPSTLPLLLRVAFDTARNLGLKEVESWNLDSALEDAMGPEVHVRKEKREGKWGAVKWYWGAYGENATGESGWDGSDEVEWMFNEKYAWC